MIVGQLSDLHIVAPGLRHFGVDTAATTRAAVDHLNAMDPRPDVVVVTGDIADSGEPEQYERARLMLDRLEPPYFVIPGNHDRRAALIAAFPDRMGENEDGFVQYAVETFPARLVALDTLADGEELGRLDRGRLPWLARTLEQEPERPTLVVMHHPPFATGIEWMDAQGLVERADLAAIVRRHDQVRLIVCGHVHRLIQGMVGGVRAAIAPSATESVGLALGGREPTFGPEPLACLLHVSSDRDFVTHTSFVPIQG